MTKNKIAQVVICLLAFGAANAVAGEIDTDDFRTRPAGTDIQGAWELFVENDGDKDAEVKVICDFGPRGLTERISVVVTANCMAKVYIYDHLYIRKLTRKPERPQCRIVSAEESFKWTPACPD